jgi:1-acyl-sn-glycerol-3-phosphate acyltransferase
MLRWLVRGLRKGLVVLAFFAFGVGALLLSLLAVPVLKLLPGGLAQYQRRVQRLTKGGFRLFHGYMRVCRLVDFAPTTTRVDLPAGPCVIIANHPTLIDVTAILAALDGVACVVKHKHFQGPMRPLLMANCHIDGGDGSATAGAAVVMQALDRLQAGMAVLIFPEGTRSPEGGLNAFHRGAFEIARRANVPIVPLMVTCDPPILAKEAPWHRVPPHAVALRIGRLPTLLSAQAPKQTKEWATQCEAMYRQQLPAAHRLNPNDLAMAMDAVA